METKTKANGAAKNQSATVKKDVQKKLTQEAIGTTVTPKPKVQGFKIKSTDCVLQSVFLCLEFSYIYFPHTNNNDFKIRVFFKIYNIYNYISFFIYLLPYRGRGFYIRSGTSNFK